MPRYIVKLHDYLFEFSTIVDAPVTWGMTLPEFKKYYRDEYGRDGYRHLEERLQRVFRWGTSYQWGNSPHDILWLNRAGPDENRLTVEEIYRAYCLKQPIRDGWQPR